MNCAPTAEGDCDRSSGRAAILDELPLLGIVAAYAAGTTTCAARELRVKESDRIAVLVRVCANSAFVTEVDDGST